MEFANRMLPSVASDTRYLLRGPFKDLYVHLSNTLQYIFGDRVIGLSGNEWDIHLSGVTVFRTLIHCNTILSFRNTIVYSIIASSLHIPFRNHFDESTLHSSFPKRFFWRLVERLRFIKWNWRFGCDRREHQIRFIFFRHHLNTFMFILHIYLGQL